MQPGDPRYGEAVTDCDDPDAPDGTFVQAPIGQALPVQPRFKGNIVGRSEFPLGGFSAHVQGAIVYQDSAWTDLRTAERALLGKQSAYTIVDLAAGISNDSYGVELFVKNAFDERAEVARYTECGVIQPGTGVPLCGLQPYIVTYLPRTIGVTFTKNF